jgi:hypothetical protein
MEEALPAERSSFEKESTERIEPLWLKREAVDGVTWTVSKLVS